MRIHTATLAALATVFAAGAAQADSTKTEARNLSDSKVSLTEAIHMAEKQGGGQAISAEYETHSGTLGYYEVKVLSNDGQKLTKYDLDTNTGKITEVSNEAFENLFTRLKPTAVQNAPTSLSRAITTAEQRANGKATDAEVNRDGDQVKYTVKVARADGKTEKVEVNGADGKVASAK
ncbi:MAG TPA: PepSY domain-containing protein [Steroidobacteraceae bacterium]|nr:PepSY domain-containing protein [Steroidobacteraceae bacterium]